MEKCIKRLRLGHANNVRDLGGYETDGGSATRWNTLYRAGDLSGADEKDWERLENAGVRTILDLRSRAEVRTNPDRPSGNIRWYHMPLQTEDFDMNDLARSAGAAFARSLKEGYVSITREHTDLLAAALKLLTKSLEDGAVLFHCSAGKDRTGVLAAAVLWLCRVGREDIIADYEVSFTYNQNGLNAAAAHLPDYEKILPLLRSDRGNMEQLLDFFGEFELEQQLAIFGFTAGEQELLRKRMTEG